MFTSPYSSRGCQIGKPFDCQERKLFEQARTKFKEIDSTNDLTFMRLRTKKHELMVAPDG